MCSDYPISKLLDAFNSSQNYLSNGVLRYKFVICRNLAISKAIYIGLALFTNFSCLVAIFELTLSNLLCSLSEVAQLGASVVAGGCGY